MLVKKLKRALTNAPSDAERLVVIAAQAENFPTSFYVSTLEGHSVFVGVDGTTQHIDWTIPGAVADRHHRIVNITRHEGAPPEITFINRKGRQFTSDEGLTGKPLRELEEVIREVGAVCTQKVVSVPLS